MKKKAVSKSRTSRTSRKPKKVSRTALSKGAARKARVKGVRKSKPRRVPKKTEKVAKAPTKPRRQTKRSVATRRVARRRKAPKSVMAPIVTAAPASLAVVPQVEQKKVAVPVRAPTAVGRPVLSEPIKIPPLLFEGDEPMLAPVEVQKNQPQSTPTTAYRSRSLESADLPEPYGTGALLLAARDPHWLYAHWDLSRENQRRYTSLSLDGHLVLRTCLESGQARPVSELRVHPESQHWFVHVQAAGERYFAILGYYGANREWVEVTRSVAVPTPPESPSEDESVEFALLGTKREVTLPSVVPSHQPDVYETVPERTQHPFPEAAPTQATGEHSLEPRAAVLSAVHDEPILPQGERPQAVVESAVTGPAELVKEERSFAERPELAPALSRMPAPEPLLRSELPESISARIASPPVPIAAPVERQPAAESVPVPRTPVDEKWTPEHERALLDLVYGLQLSEDGMGPEEDKRRPSQLTTISSEAFIQKGPTEEYPAGPSFPVTAVPLPGISSPGAPEKPVAAVPGELPGHFWMNVNAELVIYGATEPTASVTLAGRPVRLRPDGTFSYRFALPDGAYALTVQAVSKAGDTRIAKLDFSRTTHKTGEVAAHPQDPALRPPIPESI